jgi:hypothetical protein
VREIVHSRDLGRVQHGAVGDDMTEELELGIFEVTLGELRSEVVIAKSLQDDSNCLGMSLDIGAGVDNAIIAIPDAALTAESTKDPVGISLNVPGALV